MKTKLARIFAVSAVVVSHAVLGVCGFWWFVDNQAPLTNGISSISKEKVRAGEVVLINRSFCIKEETDGIMRRSVVDGVIYHLPLAGTTDFKKGCHVQAISFEVPHSLPPGRYYYHVEIDYRLNPLRTITVTLPDVHFEILPKEHSS